MTQFKNRETLLLIILLILGFLIRLAVSNNPGFHSDLVAHTDWSKTISSFGIRNVYAKTYINMPPVFAYVLYLFVYPVINFSNYSCVFLKLPGIISDVACSVVVYLIVKNRFESKDLVKNAPLIAMSLFLFNPAFIFATSIWGKWDDSLLTLFLLLIIYQRGDYKEGVFYAFAILCKLQAVILIPILIRTRGFFKLVLSFTVTFFLLLVPFISQLGLLYEKIVSKTIRENYTITINAYNLWWLFNSSGWGKEWYLSPNDTTTYFLLSPRQIGVLLFTVISVLVIFYLKKYDYKIKIICFSSFFLYFTFFVFFTRIHERYLYYCLPFLVLLVTYQLERKFLVSYIILSITFFLNMYIVFEQNYPKVFPNLFKYSFLTVSIALLNLSVYAYFMFYLFRHIRTLKISVKGNSVRWP